jgi:ABC-type sulfate/molybdate transport systems ATPase subunit
VLEFSLESHRGGFALRVECRLLSPWTVIFGPSGAGKSTLLRLLAGLDRPDRGRIKLDEVVVLDLEQGIFVRPGMRRMALVAQQPALFPHLSVAANVAFGIGSLELHVRESRVGEMLELVGAEHLATRRPRDLSGGEAQRIALARSLAPLPRLLLLDEPFSALDGNASDALLARLQGWAKGHNIQTVMATHDAADAFTTHAEVVLLREGRLAGIGSAARVLQPERERIVSRLKTSD